MSYQTFYRKYRPTDLDDVSGQQAIVKIIRNSLKLGRINHAYLFCGPRGTGKTTMARILAKNVNCLDLQDGMACGKCKNCQSILSNNCPDIIEMDAASNNGVDEIREIKNKVSLVPTELKYKVYVIDEVHMLSIGAFNALLKTLEEPPEHVIFILATTDLHKVPITIISRCQCLDFHRICEEELVNRLRYIVDTEKISVDDEILRNIANLSDGGFRDAIGMLDKLVSYSGENVTLTDFEELNGIVSIAEKKEFLKLVEEGKVSELLQFIDKIYNNGRDLAIFAQDLMILCRNLIMDYYSYQNTDYDIDFLLLFVETLNELSSLLRESNNIRILFEVKILSFVHRQNMRDGVSEKQTSSRSETVNVPIINNDGQVENTKNLVSTELNSEISTSDEERKDDLSDFELKNRNDLIINNCFCGATKNCLNFVKQIWNNLSNYALDSNYGAVACYLSDGVVRAASAHEIIVTFDYESVVSRGLKFYQKAEALLKMLFNDDYYIAFLTSDSWENEKAKYITNKNSGYQYVYKDLEKKSDLNLESDSKVNENKPILSNKSIAQEAIDLFGENMVSVNN